MPIDPQLLMQILQNASIAYADTNIAPYQYAETVAHLIVRDAAARIYAEAADAAAYIAATNAAIKMCATVSYSAQLANEKTKEQDTAKRYKHLLSMTRNRLNTDMQINTVSWSNILDHKQIHAALNIAISRYHTTFSDPLAKEALSVACALYPYAHACAYHNYIRTVAIAARYPQTQQREQFKHHMLIALQHDFGTSPIDPSFWINFMCSQTLYWLVMSCIISSIIGIVLASCALAVPAVGSAFATVGISGALLISVAAVTLCISLGVLYGRSMTKKSWEQKNQASQQAIESLNRIAISS